MTEKTPSYMDNPYVRAGLVGLVIVCVAYGSKLYYQEQRRPDTSAQEALEGKLEGWFKAFDEDAKASQDLTAFYKALPEAPSWHPANLSCGQSLVKFAPKPADWANIPTPKDWESTRTGFQMSLRREREGLTLLARRDGDCDGLYEVRRLRVGFAWTGGLTREEIVIDNENE